MWSTKPSVCKADKVERIASLLHAVSNEYNQSEWICLTALSVDLRIQRDTQRISRASWVSEFMYFETDFSTMIMEDNNKQTPGTSPLTCSHPPALYNIIARTFSPHAFYSLRGHEAHGVDVCGAAQHTKRQTRHTAHDPSQHPVPTQPPTTKLHGKRI